MSGILSAAQIAERLSPTDEPGAVTAEFVRRRMSSGRWPSHKVGRSRVMTEDDYQEVLVMLSRPATVAVRMEPRPSGVSPRSRSVRISADQQRSA